MRVPMTTDLDPLRAELEAVLASFGESSPAAAPARRLVASAGAAITRTKDPTPCATLAHIYDRRARRPGLASAKAAQCAALARAAEQAADERWHIYIVTAGERELIVFANTAGIGRFVLDFDPRA